MYLPASRLICLLLLAFASLCSCGQTGMPKEKATVADPFSEENYILTHKISMKEAQAVEQKLGSHAPDGSTEVKPIDKGNGLSALHYQRLSAYDSLPVMVIYTCRNDSVIGVYYGCGNLKGKKKEIDKREADIRAFFRKQFGEPDISAPDEHKREVTTRIDFHDRYTWKKSAQRNCHIQFDFRDSYRAGETRLDVYINF